MSNLIKWSGSKESQAKKIIEFFPKEIDSYIEPFLGGASIFLELLENNKIINNYLLSDINTELIGIYKLIQNNPDLLIETYKQHHKKFNSGDIQYRKDYFNEIRTKFNLEKKSEDFYFIMRVTTNGMPRYNRNKAFNNSCHFSRPGMNPMDVEKIIKKYHLLFNSNNVIFNNYGYNSIYYGENDVIYMDPPYQTIKKGGMYFGDFNNNDFINWLNNIPENIKWILSYDGKVNDMEVIHNKPNYIRHEYLISGNSSFRRVIGNSSDTIIHESLYLNY